MPEAKLKNFARGTLNAGIDAAVTALALQGGQGGKFPDSKFFVTIWNFTDFPSGPDADPNAENIYVTTRTGDACNPIVRGQAGTTASTHNTVGKTYYIILTGLAEHLVGTANSVNGTNATADGVEDKTLVAAGPIVVTHASRQITLDARTPAQSTQGMVLMNHPDQDVATTKIMLVSADWITLDDGYRVTPAARLVLDKGLSAGGPGAWEATPVVSSCNEIWYWRKRVDGSDCLSAHRAMDWFKDQEQATDDSSNNLGDVSANQRLSQGFKVSAVLPIDYVQIRIAKVASPTDYVYVQIQGDSSGAPNGTALAVSERISGADLITTKNWATLAFRTPFTPASTSTQYHLVAYRTAAVDAVNYYAWGAVTAGGYANGTAQKYNGTTWSASTNLDQAFRLFLRRNQSAPIAPTGGYDQKALLGYCHISAAGNIKRFRALDRSVDVFNDVAGTGGDQYLANVGTTPTLVDLQGVFPPRMVRAYFRYTPTATGNDHLQIASHFARTNMNGQDVNKYGYAVRADALQSPGRTLYSLGPVTLEYALAVMATVTGNPNEIVARGYEW